MAGPAPQEPVKAFPIQAVTSTNQTRPLTVNLLRSSRLSEDGKMMLAAASASQTGSAETIPSELCGSRRDQLSFSSDTAGYENNASSVRSNGSSIGGVDRTDPNRADRKSALSQQKCIANFALLCCLAVLVALIFSSVNIWGDMEEDITEDNCSRDCRIQLVENIPEHLSFNADGSPHFPLSAGFHALLDQARYSVEMVSPVWNLNAWDVEAKQGQLLFQRLLRLVSRGVKLKIVSSLTNSAELKTLAEHNAEVHFINMTALTRGGLHSSFWIVDRKHIYIGSAGMDWRSLFKRKELGVMVFNCSCLALDLHRVFLFYWQLHDRDYIPSIWSKRVTALYGRHDGLEMQLNSSQAVAYVSTSPERFCPKYRTKDLDAIHQVIQSAKTFIFISVTDYLPLLSWPYRGTTVTRYWSPIDEMIREAAVLRGVRVRLLISFWRRTHPLTFNFVTSLRSLCTQLINCSIEVRFFGHKERSDDLQHGLNHNKYMVTDNAVYIGNHNWVGIDFAISAGVGLVVKMKNSVPEGEVTIVEHVRAAFERDWRSPYSKSLHGNRDGQGKFRNLNQMYTEIHEENEWNRNSY